MSALSSWSLPLAVGAAALVSAGCRASPTTSSRASRSAATSSPATATVMANGLPLQHRIGPVPGDLTIHVVVGRVPRLGMVLVDGSGRTFYAFLPDRRRAVTCTGACATVWRPFKLSPSQALDSSPGLEEALLGGAPDPEGGRVVTFAGWPLYTYAGDVKAGTANGQGLSSYGGRWYVVSPEGAPIAKDR